MKKCLIAGGLTVVLVLGLAGSAMAAGWRKNDTGWWYATNDAGTAWYANGWQWIDGNGDGTAESYYFNEAGYILVNTRTPDGYDVNGDGAWVVNNVVQTKAVETQPGSVPVQASQQAEEEKTAKPRTGWYEEDGFWRYRLNNRDLEDMWRTIDGVKYYFDYNGNMATGFQDIEGNVYYFRDDGALQTKTFLLDGTYYVIPRTNGIITDEVYEEEWYNYLMDRDLQTSYPVDNMDVPSANRQTGNGNSSSGTYSYGGSLLTDEEAYERIIAMKDDYPEGMSWTNSNRYSNGYGCAGFAFLVQDTVFGKGSSRKYYDLDWSEVRVGDHLRINYDTHSVIVLTIGDDYITVCEGNYNSSIHWGRRISKSSLENGFAYRETRY